MSRLAQLLKSTVGPANHANPENDKSRVPHANSANPANADDASGEISNFSNISSDVSANSFLPGDLDALAEEATAAALSPTQESARQQVLAQLETHPTVKRALVNRFNEDGTMVVTLAIRSIGTGELLIPAERLNQTSLDDYAALLGIIGGAPMIDALSCVRHMRGFGGWHE